MGFFITMNTWSNGYVTEIGYTYGYYEELNPIRNSLALLNAGYSPVADGIHCELGFGQGLSININAAATGDEWYGNDFNPTQVAFAQNLQKVTNSNLNITDESFEEFCSRTDLPQFDTISLHGIWSWISEENRKYIVDFIRRKLKVGGVVYISYNTLPGWASFEPVRKMLTQHSQLMGHEGESIESKIKNSLKFLETVVNLNPAFLQNNEILKLKINQIKIQDPKYLAHEYFNADWQPMYFSDILRKLHPAKLTYCASANLLDQIESINLTSEMRNSLSQIENRIYKESMRDYLVNQQFRKDYWIKGGVKLSKIEREEKLKKLKVILISNPEDIILKVQGALGTANLNEQIYIPIIEFLSSHSVITLEEIYYATNKSTLNYNNLMEVVMLLVAKGNLSLVQDDVKYNKSKIHAQKLNHYFIENSINNENINYLASPLTGSAFFVSRIELMLLNESNLNNKQINLNPEKVFEKLSSLGQKLITASKPLLTKEDNIKELNEIANNLIKKKIPILKKISII